MIDEERDGAQDLAATEMLWQLQRQHHAWAWYTVCVRACMCKTQVEMDSSYKRQSNISFWHLPLNKGADWLTAQLAQHGRRQNRHQRPWQYQEARDLDFSPIPTAVWLIETIYPPQFQFPPPRNGDDSIFSTYFTSS